MDTATNTDTELSPELVALARAVNHLPTAQREEIAPLMQKVLESAGRRHRILALVQDALGQLRMDMKYLAFDAEATRRERDALQQKLDGGK